MQDNEKECLAYAARTRGGSATEADASEISTEGYWGALLLIRVASEVGTATLDMKFKVKDRAGNTYYLKNSSGSDLAITQITAAGNYSFPIDQPMGEKLIPAYTLGGASSSDGFTFGIKVVLKG